MPSKELSVAVIGAGTVGSMLVGHFLRAGYEDVAIVDIPKRINQIKENGISISRLKSIDVRPNHLFDSIGQLKDRKIDTLFVATKTTHLDAVAKEIQKIHHPDMTVISFQNGIGTEHFLAKFVDPKMVARVTVNFAGNKDEDSGDIFMSWFHPPNFLGPYYEQDLGSLRRIANLMTEVGLETRAVTHKEIKRQVFFKTILNAALNALCATTGLTMAEAMRMRHTRHLARELLREALSVAAKMGYHYGEDALEQCMNYLDKGGEHYPSMWSDLRKKRRTEIDYINGKIVKIAQMFTDVSVELNRFFCTMVMTEEIRNGVRREEDIPPYLGCSVRHCY
jgi:2-dehydropantoate 2-reductase